MPEDKAYFAFTNACDRTLKRLMEVVQDGDGILSIILAGHPKLKNDLRRPAMEEIGSRTSIFTLEGIR